MIDKELLETRKVLGKEFFESILTKFEADSQEMLEQLKQLARDGQWKDFGDAAHRLKGIAANVGAKRLAELSFRLQQAGEEGRGEDVPPLLEQVPDLFTRSLAELHEYVKTF